MSEPEIARRCTACGMSVRQHAMFCPQCGNPITQHAARDTIIDSAPTESLAPDPGATQPLMAVTPPPPELAPTQALDSVPRPRSRRASEDGVLARVERLRKVSSVMIDQAAYDPSLRFLLVAAVFFILFLALLILSKIIG
jgi:hypothetical protein